MLMVDSRHARDGARREKTGTMTEPDGERKGGDRSETKWRAVPEEDPLPKNE